MDYKVVTVWTVIKRFIITWIIIGGILLTVSCMKYKEFIMISFMNSTWEWVNAFMPCAILIIGIICLIKALFK